MKKIVTSLAIAATLSFAGLVNGVAITVDNEPITLYDIEKVRDRFKITPSKAAEILVRQIVMQKAIEDNYPEYDLEEETSTEIGARANKLNFTAKELKTKLTDGGFSWDEYRDDIKKELIRIKFLNLIRDKRLVQIPKDVELMGFYKTNIEKFTTAKEIEVIEYTSQSQKALEYIKNNPMATIEAVKSEKKRYILSQMPALLPIVNDTKEGEFTSNMKVSRESAEFVSLYITKKIGKKVQSFEESRQRVVQMLIEKKSRKAMDDYIQRLKTESDIRIVR
jgi:parvulin-like peptidyl-prolyl isomerase